MTELPGDGLGMTRRDCERARRIRYVDPWDLEILFRYSCRLGI